MRVSVGTGTYVVAVSGGVDSMVLLDLLRVRPSLTLIVAHFDHGIREDSIEDRQLVQAVAKHYGLSFIHADGKLGPGTSEATARKARYDFLQEVKKASHAQAIITAHHQDDRLETAIINILRGTGRRGLSSLKSSDNLIRPLLDYSKEQIYDYARTHNLRWREDPTNQDTAYTRNYVRKNVMSKLTPGQRAQLLILLDQLKTVNHELDTQLVNLLHDQPAHNTLDRQGFINLPHTLAREVVHSWLRHHGVSKMDKRTVERLIIAMKTGRPGQQADVDVEHVLQIGRHELALTRRDR